MTSMPTPPQLVDRETGIKFAHHVTDSKLRNGYVMTAGLHLSTERSLCLKQFDEIDCVRIEAITSRGKKAAGYVRIPADPVALRRAANFLNAVADEMAVT